MLLALEPVKEARNETENEVCFRLSAAGGEPECVCVWLQTALNAHQLVQRRQDNAELERKESFNLLVRRRIMSRVAKGSDGQLERLANRLICLDQMRSTQNPRKLHGIDRFSSQVIDEILACLYGRLFELLQRGARRHSMRTSVR